MVIIVKQKFSAKKSILAVLLLSAASTAMAVEQSVVTVSGNVTQAACTIAAADVGQTVTLADTSVEQLTAGTYNPSPFDFTFTGCDIGHTSVSAVASGSPVDTNVPGYTGVGSILANTGTSTGVGVGLIGGTSTTGTATGNWDLGVASAAAPLTDEGGGLSSGGVLSLAAQIIPLDTAATAAPGTVISSATMVFTYQ